ncbi:MAG: hypothetical protein OXI49_11725 [Acidobacteriota bacterium]|nr:hypothetical protein [Acidobacteriota bacterium]
MTSSESTGAEPAWTRGRAAARRKALTDAGMERPVAETLVDLLDEQAAPMMTRAEADARFAAILERQDMAKAEADARFAAMLERDDAKHAQHRAEINACFAEFKGEMDTRFAELKGHMDARFGSVEGRFGSIEARFGSVEGQIAGLAGQVAMLKWTFGSFMALITLLLGFLGYAMASAAS